MRQPKYFLTELSVYICLFYSKLKRFRMMMLQLIEMKSNLNIDEKIRLLICTSRLANQWIVYWTNHRLLLKYSKSITETSYLRCCYTVKQITTSDIIYANDSLYSICHIEGQWAPCCRPFRRNRAKLLDMFVANTFANFLSWETGPMPHSAIA